MCTRKCDIAKYRERFFKQESWVKFAPFDYLPLFFLISFWKKNDPIRKHQQASFSPSINLIHVQKRGDRGTFLLNNFYHLQLLNVPIGKVKVQVYFFITSPMQVASFTVSWDKDIFRIILCAKLLIVCLLKYLDLFWWVNLHIYNPYISSRISLTKRALWLLTVPCSYNILQSALLWW